MSQEIGTHAEADVYTISFNRLERKNSINVAMYATLADALSAAASGFRRYVLRSRKDTKRCSPPEMIWETSPSLRQRTPSHRCSK